MELITNTFVLVAPDCPATASVVPVAKDPAKPPVHVIQYELLTARPYTLTLEDLIYETHVCRLALPKAEARKRAAEIRAELFTKSHACMRASALPKKYGWGVHYDAAGKLALYPMESKDYRRYAAGEVRGVKVVLALRTSRSA